MTHPQCSAESCDLNEEDILPCPFCGKPPFVEQTGFHLGGRTIRCETDDCMGPHTTAVCINDAVVQWNRRIPDAAQPALETAPLRLCGYCKSWNSKPCGEGCCWSPTDPTIEKQKHNRKHPLPVTFER